MKNGYHNSSGCKRVHALAFDVTSKQRIHLVTEKWPRLLLHKRDFIKQEGVAAVFGDVSPVLVVKLSRDGLEGFCLQQCNIWWDRV
jgi:hypothetical protein